MNHFFLVLKILLGVGLVLLYPFVVQPVAISVVHRSIQRGWQARRANIAQPLLIAGSLLLLPLIVPGFLSIVRLFYALMAALLIQKLVSYLREHGWPANPVEPQREFFEFMNGYTTNYLERARPLKDGEEVPNPAFLQWLGMLKCAVIATAMVLNVSLGLWRYTPPLAATLAKLLLSVLALHGIQDMVRAGMIRKGLRPNVVLIDLRLFWSQTYALALTRATPIAHRWLLRYVYIPLGGKNQAIRNVLACFLLSGLLCEYLLSAASMKVSGLWFAYCALSGLIVCGEALLAARRDRLSQRLGQGSLGYHALRFTFPIVNLLLNVCVAHLLCMGLDQVIRFH